MSGVAWGEIHLVICFRDMPSALAASTLDANVSPKIVVSFAALVLPGTDPASPSPTVSADPLTRSLWLMADGVTPMALEASMWLG